MNIDDAVEAWEHGAGGDKELHEYLGMDFYDYAEWVQTGQLPNGWKLPEAEVQ